MAPLAEDKNAAYFLVRQSAAKWIFVTWVPENLTKVKDRMLYASTHGMLKRAFGLELLADDLHLTTLVRRRNIFLTLLFLNEH